jgi:hypothetical protein
MGQDESERTIDSLNGSERMHGKVYAMRNVLFCHLVVGLLVLVACASNPTKSPARVGDPSKSWLTEVGARWRYLRRNQEKQITKA